MRKLWLLLAVPIITLDQWVKWWVGSSAERINHTLMFDNPLIPGINLTYTENTGAAFSMLSGGGARWFLVTVSALAAAAIVAAVCKKWITGLWGVISISCVLGGAAGNLIDRVRLGYVVDMFEFTFMDFAIFNVADIFVTAGGACFLLIILLEMRKEARKKAPNANLDENPGQTGDKD